MTDIQLYQCMMVHDGTEMTAGFTSTRPGYDTDIVIFIIRPVEAFAIRINPVHDYLTIIIIHAILQQKQLAILRVWRQPMPTAQIYMIVNQVNKQQISSCQSESTVFIFSVSLSYATMACKEAMQSLQSRESISSQIKGPECSPCSPVVT